MMIESCIKKMSKRTDRMISEAFGIAVNDVTVEEKEYPIQKATERRITTEKAKSSPTPTKAIEDAATADYDFVRGNMKEAIHNCVELMPMMVELAKEAESPMLFNSVSNFMKIFADMNKTLLDSANAALKAKNGGTASTKKQPKDEQQEATPETSTVDGGHIPTEEFLKMVLEEKKRQMEAENNTIDADSK